jgi:hypothetical protein
MPHAGPAVCACARVCDRVRVWVWWRVLYAQFQYQGIWGFPSAASMSGSLLLVDVWAACLDRVRRVDMCVVRWTEAALSEPYWQSVQGERSSDVVASLPVGPGLVRVRSDVVGAVMPWA